MGRKRKGGMPRGFVSKKQWRFFYANPKLRHLASKMAHRAQRAGGGPKVAYRALPVRKGLPGVRAAAHAVPRRARRRIG